VQFLQEMNATVHKATPGIVTIAEESTSWPGVTRPTNLGGLGFSMKWNMGWMNDTLAFMQRDPIHRSFHHHELTFSLLYAFSENFVLPISHDEVVHGKGTLWGRMPGNDHMKAAGVRSLLAYQWAHPGKQLLFMGQEFGQRAEWSEERGVDWFQLDEQGFSGGIKRFTADANEIYKTRRALFSRDSSPEGYSWIDANDSANNVLSFMRFGDDGSMLACVFNFSGAEHSSYRLGLPHTDVARGAQHRRDHLQRRGRGQLWGSRGHGGSVARTPGLGGDGAAAAVRPLVRTGVTPTRLRFRRGNVR
jgi:1,4-alpha-glucan branching enzyme